MILRTGHKPDDWRDLGPANGASGPFRVMGAMVSGDSGNVEKNRRHQEKHKQTEPARAKALAYERTKRYRARQRDAA